MQVIGKIYRYNFFCIFFCLLLVGKAISQDIGAKTPYHDLISISDETTEILWAWTLLYHSSDQENKKNILSRISSSRFKESIDTSSTRRSILNLSQKFNDEILFMLYLLNEADKEERKKQFNSFYSKYSNSKVFWELNKKIVDEKIINLYDYDFSNSPTALYFLNMYANVLKVVDERIYDRIIDFKNNEFQSATFSPLEGEMLHAALFYSYYNKDQFGKIEEIYDDLISFKFFPVSYTMRNIFWSLDYVMYQTGNIDKSLNVQRKFTIPLTEYLEDEATLYSIYSSHGGNLYTLGKYREARDVFQQVLKGADDLDDQNLTRLYNNLSLVYYKTGESAKYVETQLKALQHAQSYDNYEDQIDIYRNLHVFYRKNQNTTLALSYIDRAAELAESISNKNDLISIFVSKAVFERNIDDDASKALKLLDEAEQLLDENTPSRSVIRILSEKADILNSQGNLVESIEMQTES